MILDIGARGMDAELDLPAAALRRAMGVDTTETPLAAARAPIVTPSASSDAGEYIRRHFSVLTPNGIPYALSVLSTSRRTLADSRWIGDEWIVVHAHLTAPADGDTEHFKLTGDLIVHADAGHRVLAYVRRDIRNGLIGDRPELLGQLDANQTQLVLDGSNGSWWQGFATLFKLGVAHIADGTDHLLFLLVLLLPAPLAAAGGRWRGRKSAGASLWTIVSTVSGFTLGHSLTLVLGTLGLIAVPARPVEVLIALSILASCLHAWRPLFAGRELYLAAGFGLIHGLAFASTLSGLRFDGETLAISLLGFNLGIEAMQLLVVALVMPCLIVLSRFSRSYAYLRAVGAGLGAMAATAWIIERSTDRENAVTLALRFAGEHESWLMVALAAAAAAAALKSRLELRNRVFPS